MTDYDKEFYICDMRKVFWKDYLFTYALGMKRYILHEEDTHMETRQYRMYKIAHYTFIYTLYVILLGIAYLLSPWVWSLAIGLLESVVDYYRIL